MAKILIADDEEANRILLRAILSSCGHELLEASDGEGALSVARRELPDLIILDLFMPNTDGHQVVRALRSDPATASTRVALYTASEPDAAMCDFMSYSRIEQIIPKPGDPEDVLRIVDLLLKEPQ
jgi:CheY-like chemotaxis protein